MWNSDFHADKQLTWHLHESTNGLCLKQYFIIYKFFNCSGFLAEKSNELIDSFRCQIGGQHKYDQAVKVIVFLTLFLILIPLLLSILIAVKDPNRTLFYFFVTNLTHKSKFEPIEQKNVKDCSIDAYHWWFNVSYFLFQIFLEKKLQINRPT